MATKNEPGNAISFTNVMFCANNKVKMNAIKRLPSAKPDREQLIGFLGGYCAAGELTVRW
jgi:hypothetical protein